MDESRAREILDNMDNRANNPYCDLACGFISTDVCLDGYFTIEELEAIVWCLKNQRGNHAAE